MRKPEDVFDRDWEWSQLSRFASASGAGATLGLVSGRRRQGKTYLLQALCEQAGGFFYEAIEATEPESLRHFGAHLGAYAGLPAPPVFADWESAVAALWQLGDRSPTIVVLDEFPYLVRASPSLPSILQAALAPRAQPRLRSATRLLLCGSAMSFMGRLLAGDAPLRGRAGLELVVNPFDYRVAARFWGLDHDPRLAVLVHAVVGGTPAYRREFVSNDVPRRLRDFDSWIVRTVLNRASPLFREGRYLLAEEPDLRDTALYHSVLGAVAEGRTTRGEIAASLNRAASDLTHPLNVLEDVGLLVRNEDAFRRNRPSYRISEPIVRFHHAVMRPAWSALQRPGSEAGVWRDAQDRFQAAIVGPHFEELCRTWAATPEAAELLGGEAGQVRRGVISDRAGRARLDLDIVVTGRQSRAGPVTVLAIGEAKWGQRLGEREVRRLRHARELLAKRDDIDMRRCKLLLCSGAGFESSVRSEAEHDDVVLVDLETLYT